MNDSGERTRLDRWLAAARFFKTRSHAQAAVEGGHVKVNGERVKPARELRVGDRLSIHRGGQDWSVTVRELGVRRGPASVAQTLYEEDAASREARLARREAATFEGEPAYAGRGRPSKRDRRQLTRLRGLG